MGFFSKWLTNRNREDSETEESAPEQRMLVRAPNRSAVSSAANLPRFGGLANDLDDVDTANPVRAQLRKRLGRAFPLSQPISELRQFAGRRDLLANVIRSIEEQRMHVVLYGDRGIGKTSLLHIVSLLAQEARYQVRYSSCSQSSTFDETFRAIARDIPLLYFRGADPTSEQVEAGKSLADLLDGRILTPSYFSEVLEGVSGTRLLIILDEFDRADSLEFRQSVAELIKNLSDRGTRVQILIGGVAANLAELIQHIPSIRRNLLGIPVNKMNVDEIEEIIRNGEWVAALKFDTDARAAIVRLSNGSPYLANLIAHHAGSLAVDRKESDVTSGDVSATAKDIVQSLRLRMNENAQRQFDALSAAMPAARLSELAREALDNFGRLSAGASMELAKALKDRDSKDEWIDADGMIRFGDDTIPLALWLVSGEPAAIAKPAAPAPSSGTKTVPISQLLMQRK